MKKFVIFFILIVCFSCKSVDNWQENPVLSTDTTNQANKYVEQQLRYFSLLEVRNIDIKDDLTIEELDEQLKIEKEIILSSQRVLNSWFDFFLVLRQDSGYNKAYKGHYYFRKAIEALGYGDKIRRSNIDSSLKESKYFDQVLYIEGKCRLAIGEIVAYNGTTIATDKLLKELKLLYKSMD